MSTGWEDRAADWITFARAEGHDAYWSYRESFFSLLPPPSGRVLEVGCGEGRVCRDLRARGYDIVGLDASPSLVTSAADADPVGEYVTATAEELPYDNGSIDLVIAYNSLMDVADMPRTINEIARILRPRGRFCACVLHPLMDAGRFTERGADAPFVIDGSYFDESEYEIVSDRDGIRFPFRSRRYTLQSYIAAVAVAGMVIDSIGEPVPSADRGDLQALRRWKRIPMFLHWRALKP